MSTGGIFTLITNDGKQDRMLMASELLKSRLTRLMQLRQSAGKDPTPTLMDIEKTHVLFMNSHFKPFAALGYEYNKVRPSSGSTLLGSTVQFSIPQFGDFFNDMVLHMTLSAPQVVGGTNPTYRWCQYPGERLCSRVRFTVNGNPLDDYASQDYCFFRKFEVGPVKLPGYQRCMGQEIPELGEMYQGSSTPTNNRLFCMYSDGPQTPKRVHQPLELFVPLIFWFNRDVALSIPSVAIPFGQRFIEVDLAQQSELVAIENRGTGSGGTLGQVNISTCELYINNIFVNPEVHDIFIKRIGFTLIRVHRHQVNRVVTSSGEVLLNNIRWPIEKLMIGARPPGNINTNNTDYDGNGNQFTHLDHWHSFCRSTRTDVTGGQVSAYVDAQSRTIDKLTVRAQGTNLYDDFPAGFYNSYLPFRFGKTTVTPTDLGAHLITFGLNPDQYQPSGHINISRAREFYVNYESGVGSPEISVANPMDFVVSATAINFLLISDGSAVLRYST